MEYLIRFTQWHETFRLAETQAIAYLLKIDLKILSYSDEVRKGRPPPPLTIARSALVRSCRNSNAYKNSSHPTA